MNLKDARIEQIDTKMELDFKRTEKVRMYRQDGITGCSVSTAYSIVCPLERQTYYKKTEGGKIDSRKEETASVGIEGHKLIELESKEVQVTPREELREWFQGWTSYQKQYDIKCDYSEVRVFSKIFAYGGTIDRIGEFNGRRSVIDFKTGRYSHLDLHKTEAYRQAYIEMTGDHDVGCVVLYLPRPDLLKQGHKVRHYTVERHIPCFSSFLAGYFNFKMLYYRELLKLGMSNEAVFQNPLFDLYEREYGEGSYKRGHPTPEDFKKNEWLDRQADGFG